MLHINQDSGKPAVESFECSQAEFLVQVDQVKLSVRRGNEWVAGIAQGLNVVKVSVADVRVEHEVKLMEFTKWLERDGGSPRERSDRQRIRSILAITGAPPTRSAG